MGRREMERKQRYDRSDLRRLNAISVLQQLRLGGPQSRATIAVQLGITRATVSNIAQDLIDASLVEETEYVQGAAGRPGLLLALNPNAGCMVAVELDLDRISFVLSNFGQEIMHRHDLPLPDGASSDYSLALAAKEIERILEKGSKQGLRCLGICVAWAGLVDRGVGDLAHGPISGWEHVPLKLGWEARFGVPVYVENEAHAGAIGAQHFGPTRGVENLIYVSLGVGLAAGVFVNGILMRGNQGYAGQIGHTFFGDNGIICRCGRQGCWVTEIGAEAVLGKLRRAGFDREGEIEPEGDWLEVAQGRARAGDPTVMGVLGEVGRQLGQGLAGLVQIFNPSVVIVGGRLGGLMQWVKPIIQQELRQKTLPYISKGVDVIVNSSDQDHMLGCLATVFDAVMQNPEIGKDSRRAGSAAPTRL
jgi:predicted NBD/HSP70 family sugar kinase